MAYTEVHSRKRVLRITQKRDLTPSRWQGPLPLPSPMFGQITEVRFFEKIFFFILGCSKNLHYLALESLGGAIPLKLLNTTYSF